MPICLFKLLNIQFFSTCVLFIAAMKLRKTGIRHFTAFPLSCRTLKCEGWILCFPFSAGDMREGFNHTAVDHFESPSGTQTAEFQGVFSGNTLVMFSVHHCLSSSLSFFCLCNKGEATPDTSPFKTKKHNSSLALVIDVGVVGN